MSNSRFYNKTPGNGESYDVCVLSHFTFFYKHMHHQLIWCLFVSFVSVICWNVFHICICVVQFFWQQGQLLRGRGLQRDRCAYIMLYLIREQTVTECRKTNLQTISDAQATIHSSF